MIRPNLNRGAQLKRLTFLVRAPQAYVPISSILALPHQKKNGTNS